VNPDLLLAEFERVVEAPDAVERVRKFIRELAVRGKLIDPDAGLRGGKTSGDSPQTAAAFPSPWPWVAIREVADCRLGKMLDKAKNRGTPRRYLRNVNVRWFDFDLTDVKEMPFEDAELDEFALRAGDVLICEGGEPGRAAVWDAREDGIYFQKALHRVRLSPSVDPDFFVLTLRVSASNGSLAEIFTGATFHHLTGSALAKYRFPLPPLATQRRIVAKVDELMALCDQLEEGQAGRNRRRARLTSSALRSLDEDSDGSAGDVRKSAAFVLRNLEALTASADQVPALRRSILHQATRGNLVPQDPNDTPASELFRQIAREAAGDFKRRDGLLHECAAGAVEMPCGWERVPLIALGRWASGCGFPRSEQGRTDGPFFFVKVGDMNLPGNEREIVTCRNHIDQDAARRMRAKIHAAGTIVFPKIGGAIATNKRRILTRPSAIDNNCLGITCWPQLSLDWCYLLLTTLDFTRYQVGTATPALQQTVLERIPVGLPPFDEQLRIVAKVDELMAVCDGLESSLIATQTTRTRLLEAVLQRALSEDGVDSERVLAGAS
jgi:type I restriction enzyme, S subunit